MTLKKLIFLIVFSSLLITLIQVGCDELITQQNNIEIAGHPTADFGLDSGYKDHSCDTLTVKFKDLSDGPRDKWLWIFGDGDSSTDSAPTHFYSGDGMYNVTLRIEDTETEGKDAITKKRFILIGSATASFTSSVNSGCANLWVKFRPDYYDVNHTYKWDFGDGSTKTDTAPEHYYDSVGIFEVALQVVGDSCGDVFVYDTVEVQACPFPDINADQTEGCVPLTVNFADVSVPYDDNYILLPAQSDWDFGDGTTLTDVQDPSHTYDAPGVYTVKLTAVSDGGTRTDSFVDYITVHDSTTASFSTIGDLQVCKSAFSQYQIKLHNTSTGTIDSTLWRIENDTDTITLMTTDTIAIMAVTNPGIYDITMVTYGFCNADSTTEIDQIVYSEPLDDKLDSLVITLPEFSYPDSTYTIQYFTSGVISSWSWDFGDGDTRDFDNPVEHIYADTGHYEVKLTLTNPCGSYEFIDSIVVVPLPAK